jgi:type I restriction enzyme S subunit
MYDLPFELPVGWKVFSVEELVREKIIDKPLDGNHGGTHPKSADYVETGVPFVMASDLKNGSVDLAGCKFIKTDQASSLRKGFSKAGDVLLSHKATIGRTALVQENEHDFIMLTPQVTYYRVIDSQKLSNQYLKTYFDSRFFQTILGLWAGAGSTRSYLGITGQLKLPVIVPPIDIQNKIEQQVLAFNKKLDVNRDINQTLEQITQAIFKSWFVDFEPVKAKIAAREALLAASPTATVEQIAKAEQQAAINAISGAGDVVPTEQLQTLCRPIP